MNLFKMFRDWINERGSAAIMEKRLALKDDEIRQLKTKISDLEIAHEKQKNEADEVVIHRGIEFRRGKRTNNKWAAFCPACHLPVSNQEGYLDVSCSNKSCKWGVRLDNQSLSQVLDEIKQ